MTTVLNLFLKVWRGRGGRGVGECVCVCVCVDKCLIGLKGRMVATGFQLIPT